MLHHFVETTFTDEYEDGKLFEGVQTTDFSKWILFSN